MRALFGFVLFWIGFIFFILGVGSVQNLWINQVQWNWSSVSLGLLAFPLSYAAFLFAYRRFREKPINIVRKGLADHAVIDDEFISNSVRKEKELRKRDAKKVLLTWLGFLALTTLAQLLNEPEVNQQVISEKDAEYLIKGIDVDTGIFNLDTPTNETQALLSVGMQDMNKLNLETNKKIANIEPFEFSAFSELKSKTDVSEFQRNLKDYWDIRKTHYDSADTLLRHHRKELNYGSDQDERLSGTTMRFIEILEENYVFDLNKFYEFILTHHEEITVTDDQIYIEDQDLVDSLNALWEKTVKSSTELTTVQETGYKIMTETIKEFQSEISDKLN